MKKQGFTIVELLVIIVVIGILSTISVFAYKGVQAQARDAARVADLEGIADAIKLHRLKYGDDIQGSSGCGGSGNGNGWFAYEAPAAAYPYPKSILNCLIEKGYLNSSFTEPFNCATTSIALPGKTCSPTGYAYMKYTCGTGDNAITYLYARLETNDDSDKQKLIDANICYSDTVAGYGMNHMLIVD